jgi:hypothetical protein
VWQVCLLISQQEAAMSLCEFNGCKESGNRRFDAIDSIWLCEEHFHKCVIAAADLQAKTPVCLGEFQRSWLRERNLPEQWTKADLTNAEFLDLIHATRAEFNKAVNRELSCWLKENCTGNK